MRLRVRHVTGFSYDGAADSSYNEVRMTPLSLPHQRVEISSLVITPYALQSTYRDYFDTIVTTFDLHESHERL
jgi:transglutaminase-like putative cysteine protease